MFDLVGSLQTRIQRLTRHILVSSENIWQFQNRSGTCMCVSVYCSLRTRCSHCNLGTVIGLPDLKPNCNSRDPKSWHVSFIYKVLRSASCDFLMRETSLCEAPILAATNICFHWSHNFSSLDVRNYSWIHCSASN